PIVSYNRFGLPKLLYAPNGFSISRPEARRGFRKSGGLFAEDSHLLAVALVDVNARLFKSISEFILGGKAPQIDSLRRQTLRHPRRHERQDAAAAHQRKGQAHVDLVVAGLVYLDA